MAQRNGQLKVPLRSAPFPPDLLSLSRIQSTSSYRSCSHTKRSLYVLGRRKPYLKITIDSRMRRAFTQSCTDPHEAADIMALVARDYATAVDKQTFDGQYTAHSVVVTLSIALALSNSLEMILLISSTFKRWRGLYFWSLTICNLGVILYSIGLMMGYFTLGARWLGKVFNDVGWVLMITCQSLVLYSRLGLILDNPKILGGVKWMIITTSVLILPTVCILDFGTTYSRLSTFPAAYFYIEHIQLTAITLQELIISGLYMWKTLDLLKVIAGTNTRSIIWQLFIMSVLIIAMDVRNHTLQTHQSANTRSRFLL